MSDPSKKEIDKLFQQGMEQDHFEYNPTAWGQMEELLDRHHRRRIVVWWWLSGVAAALLIGMSLFLIEKQEGEKSIEADNFKNSTEKTTTERTNGKQEQENHVAYPGFKQEESPDSEKSVSNHPVPPAAPAKENKEKPPVATLEENRSKNPQKANSTIVAMQQKAKLQAETPPNVEASNGNAFDEPEKKAIVAIELSPLSASGFSVVNSENETVDAIHVSNVIGVGASPTKVAPSPKHEFVLGLRSAGEFTSVGLDNFSRHSWNAGIFMEYRYAGKYSLGLGANYIHNNYHAGTGEYAPPYGFWTRRIAPQYTEGTCNIIEMPIQLSYFQRGYRRSGFFASAGVTSYFMLHESYYYHYEHPEPDLIRWWSTNKESSYWFGIGQVSVGYNKMLGKQFSLQVAPYFQIPFSGVGHGNVKLYSIGTSIRFNVHLK